MTRRSLLMLATILAGMTGAVWARADGHPGDSQTAAIEAEAEVRNLVLDPDGDRSTADRHLTVSERLEFAPADPARGPLERVALSVTLHIEQGFSGVVGDAAPLEETAERVVLQGRLTTRLDIVGPDGGHLLSTTIPSATAGCAALRSCTFSHHERHPIEMRFEPPPRLFEGREPVSLILRATTTGGVLNQICGPAESWGRCQVLQARVGVTAPKDGIRLSYVHESAAAAAAPPAEPAIWAFIPGKLTGALFGIVLLGAAAAGIWRLTRRTAASRTA